MFPFRKIIIAALVSVCIPVLATAKSPLANPDDLSQSQLEQRLAEIDTELEQLASYSLRSGVGSVGHQSKPHRTPDNKEWIRIKLGEALPVDQVVLVPTIWRDSKVGLQAEGFPVAFRILAGSGDTTNVVATFTSEDHLLPRIAPLAISFPPVNASWVGVEATTLSPRDWDQRHVLQFSEIMVFSGKENVAINQSVSTSSFSKSDGRHPRFLVDGFVPYLMDAAHGTKSKATLLQVKTASQQIRLMIDLGQSYPVNQINLHTVDLSHTIPEAAPNGHAVPRRLRAMGANKPDFSDQTLLFEYQQESIYDSGPIIIRRFPETSCRYVQLIALDQPNALFRKGRLRFGFAEVEILSKGRNLAAGKPVTLTSGSPKPADMLPRMTDGNNFFGAILPIRDWMHQLARRHDLETERPKVKAGLDARYALHKKNLRRMSWLAGVLAVLIVLSTLINRRINRRKLAKMRTRFAADLHDELGANLHVIGLLGDLAQAAVNSPEKLKKLHQRIRILTERSGIAVRKCTNMLEAKELCDDLQEDMRRSTERIMADFDHDITFQGANYLHSLKPHTRIDLFLFHKECLVNISRHSRATKCAAQLTATPKEICLTVTDNGQGMEDPTQIPGSLKRRARLLKGRVSAEPIAGGGTKITLQLRISRTS